MLRFTRDYYHIKVFSNNIMIFKMSNEHDVKRFFGFILTKIPSSLSLEDNKYRITIFLADAFRALWHTLCRIGS